MTNFLVSFFSKFSVTEATKTPLTFDNFNAGLRQRHFFDKKEFDGRPRYIGLSPINYRIAPNREKFVGGCVVLLKERVSRLRYTAFESCSDLESCS